MQFKQKILTCVSSLIPRPHVLPSGCGYNTGFFGCAESTCVHKVCVIQHDSHVILILCSAAQSTS